MWHVSRKSRRRARGQRSVDGQRRYSVLRTGFRFNRHAAHQSRESPEFTRPQTPCSSSSGTRWRSTSPGVLPPSPAVPGRKSEPKTSTGQSGHYTRCILTAAFRKFIQPPVPPFLIDPFELLDTSNKPTFPIWLNIPLSKSSAFFKPLSICEMLAVGMAIITP